MTCSSLCLICEELRAAVLETTHQHMTMLMRLQSEDQGAGSHGIGELERLLEEARRRKDDAVYAYETHQRIHTEVASVA